MSKIVSQSPRASRSNPRPNKVDTPDAIDEAYEVLEKYIRATGEQEAINALALFNEHIDVLETQIETGLDRIDGLYEEIGEKDIEIEDLEKRINEGPMTKALERFADVRNWNFHLEHGATWNPFPADGEYDPTVVASQALKESN